MISRRSPASVALVLVLASAGCGGNSLGTLGDILGASSAPAGNTRSQLTAEVRSVDTQRQRIEVRTQQGETGWVQYDQNTVVVYRQQQYPVTALERGDVVLLQAEESAQGGAYVSRIDVQQSVQERSGASGGAGGGEGVQQFGGRVGQIDYDRGLFVLQTQSGNVTVALPYNAPQATVDYFRRLRSGDTVRLEAVPVSNSRLEIYRFL